MDKFRNRVIKEIVKKKDIGYIIKKLKFKYVGQMARNKTDKWNKLITEWVPYDRKRKKGRPAIRWLDEIREIGGPQWTIRAQNRADWKWVMETHAL